MVYNNCNMLNNTVFHVDMDAFYAAIEQYDNPEYRNQPVIIGNKEGRSVVSACSYEARKFGVHSAMSGYEAKRRCPHAIFLPVNMNKYMKISSQIMSILNSFTPSVYQVSIDEAYLEMNGTQKLFGSPLEVGRKIKEKILLETGLTISVGIASNPLLAKMASEFNKPDGLFQVMPNKNIDFIDKHSLSQIWGIGKKSFKKLESRGLTKPSQIRVKTIEQLKQSYGNSFGEYLYKSCRAISSIELNLNKKNKSISNEKTFRYDINSHETIKNYLLTLSHQLMFRLMDKNETAKTVIIKIRYSNFETISARQTSSFSIKNGEDLFKRAMNLLEKKWRKQEPIRLIGLGVSNLVSINKEDDSELFEDDWKKKNSVEHAVFKIMKKGSPIGKASSFLL